MGIVEKMFTRIVTQKLSPRTYNILKLTRNVQTIARSSTYKQTQRCSIVQQNLIIKRFYSEPIINPEEMIVDYKYVQGATKNKDIYIIDVREAEEIKEHGKIPNSINIPLSNVTPILGNVSEKEFQQIYSREKPSEESEIIFYCMIGKRSGMAQQNALNLGYKNAKNYVGSWTDWASKTQ